MTKKPIKPRGRPVGWRSEDARRFPVSTTVSTDAGKKLVRLARKSQLSLSAQVREIIECATAAA
jgi:hypothetical protein